MGRTFYIADTHFGHANCIRFDSRPFETIKEHDVALMANKDLILMAAEFVTEALLFPIQKIPSSPPKISNTMTAMKSFNGGSGKL